MRDKSKSKINKTDLAALVAKRCGVSKAVAAKMISATFGQILVSIANGTRVTLNGFGSFKTVRQSPRAVRNPKTGKLLKVPAKQIPKFMPSENFKFCVLHKSRGLAYYAGAMENDPSTVS